MTASEAYWLFMMEFLAAVDVAKLFRAHNACLFRFVFEKGDVIGSKLFDQEVIGSPVGFGQRYDGV